MLWKERKKPGRLRGIGSTQDGLGGGGAVAILNTEERVGLTVKVTLEQRLEEGACVVAQWLGVCLPVRGTRVRVLVWEDPTCRGAAGPVSHNY